MEGIGSKSVVSDRDHRATHRDSTEPRSERSERDVRTNELIEAVLPAHNEGASIGLTMREFHDVVSEKCGLPIKFLVCEDGSTDDTCDVVRNVGRDLPVRLLSFTERKGY